MTSVYYEGIGYIKVKSVDVIDIDDNVIGYCYIPIDDSVLDIVDDPLTLWASDHGYNVDDIWLAE